MVAAIAATMVMTTVAAMKMPTATETVSASTKTRIGIVQLSSSDDVATNLAATLSFIAEAADQGARIIFTPEATNCISTERSHQEHVLQLENEDLTLQALCAAAATHSVWLSIGSLGVKTGDADGRFANRQFLISCTGDIVAKYDKIHMFDACVSAKERYEESASYRVGCALLACVRMMDFVSLCSIFVSISTIYKTIYNHNRAIVFSYMIAAGLSRRRRRYSLRPLWTLHVL